MIESPHALGTKDYIGDVEIAKTQLKLNKFGRKALIEQIEEHSIDCDIQHSGKYQCAVEDRGIKVLDIYSRGLEKIGDEFERISGKDLPDHIGTSFYKDAIYTPGTSLMQPSALTKGLADNLPKNVLLYEKTPISAVNYGEKNELIHENGKITADIVVLANNAFAQHFGFDKLKNTMLSIFLYASLTRPLNKEEQEKLGGKKSWGIIPAHTSGSPLRRMPDQRILVRNSMTFNKNGLPSFEKLQGLKEKHRLTFDRRFPMLPNVEFEYSWSGGLSLAQNHEDFFGKLRDNVFATVCCNGLGVVRGTARGTLLADYIAGKKNELIDFLLSFNGPSKLPPEPFLSVGVHSRLAWEHWRSGLER